MNISFTIQSTERLSEASAKSITEIKQLLIDSNKQSNYIVHLTSLIQSMLTFQFTINKRGQGFPVDLMCTTCWIVCGSVMGF